MHYKALLAFSPAGIPAVPRPVSSPTDTDDVGSSPLAASAAPQMVAAASPRPQPDELDTPLSTASLFDADDLCSFAQVVSARDVSARDVSDGGGPVASDAFLSHVFGEEAQKIFQPFL